MAMKQYIKGNISHEAATSVKYFTKMLAQACETIIFMFLGLSTIANHQHWDPAFMILTVVFCLVYRVIGIYYYVNLTTLSNPSVKLIQKLILGVIVQCLILNRFRKRQFLKVDQFIMCYGGLRGAIAFGLVVSLPDSIEARSMFITGCITVIYVTVLFQVSFASFIH